TKRGAGGARRGTRRIRTYRRIEPFLRPSKAKSFPARYRSGPPLVTGRVDLNMVAGRDGRTGQFRPEGLSREPAVGCSSYSTDIRIAFHEESRMRTHTRRRVAGMALLAAGLGWIVTPKMTAADSSASVYKPVLPDAVFAKLVADDAKIIRDS